MSLIAARDDGATRRLRVLVAEDHPTNRKVIELMLAQAPVDLVLVENGALAVDAFADAPFDLILMDMQMPVMDGLEAARRIRERETTHATPRAAIVFLTANALAEHAEASHAAGGDAHLTKPIKIDELLGMVGRFADAAEERRAA